MLTQKGEKCQKKLGFLEQVRTLKKMQHFCLGGAQQFWGNKFDF